MNEQVFTMTTSASLASLVIWIPSFSNEPSMISASTRFLAQPSEIMPTRSGPLPCGLELEFFFVTEAGIITEFWRVAIDFGWLKQ